jgi:N-acetylneuraminic acid mutarotase
MLKRAVLNTCSGIFSCTAAVYSSVETYDPVDDVWGKIANMSEPRHGCAAVASSGRLYVLGGHDESHPLSSVEVFNPADGTWSYVASMSTPRRGVAAVELPGNKILACGGWDGAQLLKSCELYDVELDRWSDMRCDMVSGRMYHGICAANGT